MVVLTTGRSLIVQDFIDQNLELLEHLLLGSENPTFYTRISDVLWLRKKQLKYAQQAFDSYLKHVEENYNGEDWIYSFDSLGFHAPSIVSRRNWGPIGPWTFKA